MTLSSSSRTFSSSSSGTLDYNPEEMDKRIDDLSRPKAQVVTAPSLAEENGEILPGIGVSQINSGGTTRAEFPVTRSEREQLQRMVARLSATQVVTK